MIAIVAVIVEILLRLVFTGVRCCMMMKLNLSMLIVTITTVIRIVT